MTALLLETNSPSCLTLDDASSATPTWTRPETRLLIETTGSVDTLGNLFDHAGDWIAESDDEGEDLNFRLVRAMPAGTYSLGIGSYGGSTGAYILVVQEDSN